MKAVKRSEKSTRKDETGPDAFGKQGPKFLTMTRADYNAYEYLCRQAEAKEWIEAIIGESLGEEKDAYKLLGNGVVLCRLINTMWPGTIKYINKPNSFAFKLRENITFFLEACAAKGLNASDIFSVEDLFGKNNMPLVLVSMQKLAEMACKEGFKIKWKSRNDRNFSPDEIQQAKLIPQVDEGLWNDKNPPTNLGEDETEKRRLEEQRRKEEEEKARLAQEAQRALQLKLEEEERLRLQKLKRRRRGSRKRKKKKRRRGIGKKKKTRRRIRIGKKEKRKRKGRRIT